MKHDDNFGEEVDPEEADMYRNEVIAKARALCKC